MQNINMFCQKSCNKEIKYDAKITTFNSLMFLLIACSTVHHILQYCLVIVCILVLSFLMHLSVMHVGCLGRLFD